MSKKQIIMEISENFRKYRQYFGIYRYFYPFFGIFPYISYPCKCSVADRQQRNRVEVNIDKYTIFVTGYRSMEISENFRKYRQYFGIYRYFNRFFGIFPDISYQSSLRIGYKICPFFL